MARKTQAPKPHGSSQEGHNPPAQQYDPQDCREWTAWRARVVSECRELVAGGERMAALVVQLRARRHRKGHEARLAASIDEVRETLMGRLTWHGTKPPKDFGAWADSVHGIQVLVLGAQAGYLYPMPSGALRHYRHHYETRTQPVQKAGPGEPHDDGSQLY